MSKKRAIVFPAASKPRSVEDWSPEDRLRVVAEAAKLSEDDLGSFLRREGLHEATLREWRAAALEGLSSERAIRSQQKRGVEQKRVRDLERELRRKEKALAEAAALARVWSAHARCSASRLGH